MTSQRSALLPNPRLAARMLAAPVLAACSGAALAHAGADLGAHHGSAFMAGFAHPFGGADHLLAMLAVGVWSALTLTGARRWAAPASFAAMLFIGALLGLSGLSMPGVEPVIAASLLALGLLLAARAALPAWGASMLAGGFAVFHGLAHGSELAAASSPPAALAGMLIATALLHGAGLLIGSVLAGRQAWLPRAAGAVVAGFGLALLAA